ncbi:acyl-protein synthetase [Bacillus tianshenii]|nr:acyl-protein synthetase [Bacillus tianshenii]
MTVQFSANPFEMEKQEKEAYLVQEMSRLTQFHTENCQEYKNILENMRLFTSAERLHELPFLPVQLFKMLELYSVPKENILKTLTSSGTTSQVVSKIFLDKETSMLQSRALINIVQSFVGKKRLPMIILDSKSVIKNRKSFSARGAGILGFSNFGRNHFYALNDSMELDEEGLQAFLDKHQGEQILLFGFTFMVWQYFYQVCRERGLNFNLSDGLLIHGGGWKKLKDEAVSNDDFKAALREQFGLARIHNYYGMVEQVGSIFMECEHGYFHPPHFADVLVRDMNSLEVLSYKEKGLLQVLSILPKSYPGHSLLTEDLGEIIGEDDCSCGRKGRYFTVEGRLPKAEIRGCSDTHAFDQRGALR